MTEPAAIPPQQMPPCHMFEVDPQALNEALEAFILAPARHVEVIQKVRAPAVHLRDRSTQSFSDGSARVEHSPYISSLSMRGIMQCRAQHHVDKAAARVAARRCLNPFDQLQACRPAVLRTLLCPFQSIRLSRVTCRSRSWRQMRQAGLSHSMCPSQALTARPSPLRTQSRSLAIAF